MGRIEIVTLRADAPADRPGFVEAQVLPGRGMMLLQAKLRLLTGEIVDALFSPSPDELADAFGGPDDFAGNKTFAFGGAVLIPYANRIRGRDLGEAREIEATVDGRSARLPRNWGGKAPGAAQYAMHGLILQTPVPYERLSPGRLTGRLDAGDFGGRWPGRAEFDFEWRLENGELALGVTARNVGDADLPLGIGFHPYMALPSGDRRQARLRLSAQVRTEVNNYDEVLPTGRLPPNAGTPYDFGEGPALGDLFLDDCFTELARQDGRVVVEVEDPLAGIGYRFASQSPHVKAVQVYAPPEKPFVVVEPQFNVADPFGDVWPAGMDTGMARLKPGASLTYDCLLSAYAVGNRSRG
ncbi:aldose 1-epimerase [Phenylobacterium sp. J426]|uniref:aldose 1-epimerase n=1 Tax=Phenylobacterium sp. J426 TaxID=2898439 RepID=UPI0021514893|nr:aldose 1-epimerase [Phenylobacterium sp. J426]MCR5876132.1 aldose 1-epimerase [Phenylobacterium sp. J426]